MATSTRRTLVVGFAVAVVALLTVEIVAAAHLEAAGKPTLMGAAITVDLILGLPALAWWLVLRRTRVGLVAIVPVVLVAVVLADVLVPAPHDTAVVVLQRMLPAVEVAVVAYAVWHLRAVIAVYRQLRPAAVYGYDAVESAARQTLGGGRVLSVALTELAMLGLAILGWRRHYDAPAGATSYSVYRQSGYTGMLVLLCGTAAIEIVAVHLLVRRWSDLVAWTLTALSIYGVLWLLGDYHAVRLQPHVVDDRYLHVRTGLRWRVDVPLDAVRDVRRWRTDDDEITSVALLGDPNVVVELDCSVIVEGMFGIRRQARALGLTVDDPDAFVADLWGRTGRGR